MTILIAFVTGADDEGCTKGTDVELQLNKGWGEDCSSLKLFKIVGILPPAFHSAVVGGLGYVSAHHMTRG